MGPAFPWIGLDWDACISIGRHEHEFSMIVLVSCIEQTEWGKSRPRSSFRPERS